PFAETKEVLAGFTLIEARDLNEALRQASKLAACSRASIEVRPLMQPGVEMANERDRRIQAALSEAALETR
ncbi:MAG TPA: YciI family protein, partial [Usitatibacter sp.]